jgi:hypothetical protein
VVSNGMRMPGKEVFLDNGFTKTAEREQFELVILLLMEGVGPLASAILTDTPQGI